LSIWAGTSPAATISFTFNGSVNSGTVQRSLDSGATFTNLTVGQMRMTVTGSSGFSGYVPASMLSFCLEPQQSVSAGTSYTYTIDPLDLAPTNVSGGMGAIKADLLRELYGRYYPSFQVNLTPLMATALQIATWEIVRETSGVYNVMTGSVRFQSPSIGNMLTEANTMLASLNGTGPMLQHLYAVRGTSNQDLAFHAVPEPAPLGTLGAALVALGAWRRRGRSA